MIQGEEKPPQAIEPSTQATLRSELTPEMSLENAWKILEATAALDPLTISTEADFAMAFTSVHQAVFRAATDIILHPDSHQVNGQPNHQTNTNWLSEELFDPNKPRHEQLEHPSIRRKHKLWLGYVDKEESVSVHQNEGLAKIMTTGLPIKGNEQLITSGMPREIVYVQAVGSEGRPSDIMVGGFHETLTVKFTRVIPPKTPHVPLMLASNEFDIVVNAGEVDTFLFHSRTHELAHRPVHTVLGVQAPGDLTGFELSSDGWSTLPRPAESPNELQERYHLIANGIKEAARVIYNRSRELHRAPTLPYPDSQYLFTNTRKR